MDGDAMEEESNGYMCKVGGWTRKTDRQTESNKTITGKPTDAHSRKIDR